MPQHHVKEPVGLSVLADISCLGFFLVLPGTRGHYSLCVYMRIWELVDNFYDVYIERGRERRERGGERERGILALTCSWF